jgi:hypothetical protein
MSRPYGTDMDRAKRVGNRHVHKKPGHTVRLLRGMTVIDTISSENPVLPLHIQWASEHPEHQSSLRSLHKRD